MSSSNENGFFASPDVSSSLHSYPPTYGGGSSSTSQYSPGYAQRAKESEVKLCAPTTSLQSASSPVASLNQQAPSFGSPYLPRINTDMFYGAGPLAPMYGDHGGDDTEIARNQVPGETFANFIPPSNSVSSWPSAREMNHGRHPFMTPDLNPRVRNEEDRAGAGARERRGPRPLRKHHARELGAEIARRAGAESQLPWETFAIYSPHVQRPDLKEQCVSFSTTDLGYSQANLGIGGCLISISVHEPAEAASWVENNWDSSLLTSIRNSGCTGPVAWMLSPAEPALAIFGNLDNPGVANMAESLAQASGFPILVRSPGDNPALTLLAHDADTCNYSAQFGGTGGNKNERDDGEDGAEDDDTPEESNNGGHRDDDLDNTEGTDDEDGDGGGPAPTDGKWNSPLHRTRVKLRLKLATGHTYAAAIGYTFKFTINRETEIPIDLEDLSRPLSQPEVMALVDFEIETRPRETQIDRSYASIGFVAHRRKSIIQRKFLHRGFDPPDKLYRLEQHRQIQRGIKGALGFAQGSPLATANFSYNRNNDTTLAATDSKVMPRCRVDYETGDEWDEGHKSYSSYNIAYQLQDMRLDAERSEFHPLEVKVGIGVNFRPAGSKQPLPQISFINRNQVLIWVSDPTSRARMRGIVVLMNSYLDNIRTEEELEIYEQEEIELARPLKVPKTKEEPHEPGTISLSIAQVDHQSASGSNKFGAAFIAKLGQRSSASPIDIPPHEYLARGWDVNNNQWRSVLWPALDKRFRAAALEGKSPVWNIRRDSVKESIHGEFECESKKLNTLMKSAAAAAPEVRKQLQPFGSGDAASSSKPKSTLTVNSRAKPSDNSIDGKECSHCHSRSTPLWRHDPRTHKLLCNACGVSLTQQGELRPQNLIAVNNEHPIEEDSDGDYDEPECSNCGTRKTPTWRRNKAGDQVCNACGVYERVNGKPRPLSLIGVHQWSRPNPWQQG